MEGVAVYRTLKTFLDKQARDNNLLGEKVSIHESPFRRRSHRKAAAAGLSPHKGKRKAASG